MLTLALLLTNVPAATLASTLITSVKVAPIMQAVASSELAIM